METRKKLTPGTKPMNSAGAEEVRLVRRKRGMLWIL
jgi:hypothetical protein